MLKSRPIVQLIFIPVLIFFVLFLLLPVGAMFVQSIKMGDSFTIQHYIQALTDKNIQRSMVHSLTVSSVAASITTVLAFMMAYTIHMTRLPKKFKGVVRVGVMIPMLLPTITYGFVIMYAFGNQGILVKLFGESDFSIYGFNGLLIGYVLYTLPAAFMLIFNGFGYVDQRFILVSHLMGDSFWRRFYHTMFRPLLSAIGGAFVLSFVLSFTDFGIPASIGGEYQVIATTLYQAMLGSIPKMEQGAVIAVFMLVPAVIGVLLLSVLDRFSFQADSTNVDRVLKSRVRDLFFGAFSGGIITGICLLFLVMFIVPFTASYPYQLSFTMDHFKDALGENQLMAVFKNSLFIALLTAIVGTILAFLASILSVRTSLPFKKSLNWVAMITNTVPGMVLGLSYLFLFNGSSLKGTFMIIIICNIVHFFTTPFLMAKNALQKMDASWEVIGELLNDSWLKTVIRVIIPNMKKTLVEMFSYYFINAMVTISGVIFLVTTTTGLMATKINELQHFNNFNDIFILSIFIFITNLGMKLLADYYVYRNKKQKITKVKLKEVA